MKRQIVFALLAALLAVAPARASNDVGALAEKLIELRAFSGDIACSPDGSRLAYCTRSPGDRHELHIIEISGGKELPIPAALTNASFLSWSPDSKSLAWIARPFDSPSVLAIWNLDGGQCREVPGLNLHPFPTPVMPAWLDGGRTLVLRRLLSTKPIATTAPLAGNPFGDFPPEALCEVYASTPSAAPSTAAAGARDLGLSTADGVFRRLMVPLMTLATHTEPGELVAVDAQTLSVRSLVTGILASSDQWLVPIPGMAAVLCDVSGKKGHQLHWIAAEASAKTLAVTDDKPLVDNLDFAPGSFAVSTSGKKAAIVQVKDNQPLAVWLLDFNTHELVKALDFPPPTKPAKKLACNSGNLPFVSGPTGRALSYEFCPLLWSSTDDSLTGVIGGDVWRFDLKARRIENLTGKSTTFFIRHGGWRVHDKSVVVDYLESDGVHGGAAVVSTADGESADVQTLWRDTTSWFLLAGDQLSQPLIFHHESGNQPPELFAISRNAPASLPRTSLTAVNQSLTVEELGEYPAELTWTVRGASVSGAMVLPKNTSRVRDGKFPLLLEVYPGSNPAGDRNYFGLLDAPARLAVMRGYAVLQPGMPLRPPKDPQANVRKELVEDTLASVDAAISTGKIDGNRMAIIGHSWGGYQVYCVVAGTTRFKAAVAVAGYADCTTFYFDVSEQSMMLSEQKLGATPWKDPQRYVQSSPIFDFDKVTTPLLIVHGINDRRVSIANSEMAYRGLASLDKAAVLLRYRNAAHSHLNWPEPARHDFYSRVQSWLDEYVAP